MAGLPQAVRTVLPPRVIHCSPLASALLTRDRAHTVSHSPVRHAVREDLHETGECELLGLTSPSRLFRVSFLRALYTHRYTGLQSTYVFATCTPKKHDSVRYSVTQAPGYMGSVPRDTRDAPHRPRHDSHVFTAQFLWPPACPFALTPQRRPGPSGCRSPDVLGCVRHLRPSTPPDQQVAGARDTEEAALHRPGRRAIEALRVQGRCALLAEAAPRLLRV